jgi:hypothetical protein
MNTITFMERKVCASLAGGVAAAAGYFISCRWVEGVLSDENTNRNVANPPGESELVAYALGMAMFGFAVGMTSGAFTKPWIAAGTGAALGSLPLIGVMLIVNSSSPHTWVIKPVSIFLVTLIVIGAISGAVGSLVGQWMTSRPINCPPK